MPRVGFELLSQCLSGAKTVHALDRAAAVIGIRFFTTQKMEGYA
jgi:hypothetical protein